MTFLAYKKTMNYTKIAREILEQNKYIVLGTTDGKRSWVAPVYYTMDEDYNFYFISQEGSRHIQDLSFSNTMSFAIFDSHQMEGTGQGVQGLGRVTKLVGKALIKGLAYYSTDFVTLTEEELQKPGGYKLFKIVIEELYVLDPKAKVDKRVRIDLKAIML